MRHVVVVRRTSPVASRRMARVGVLAGLPRRRPRCVERASASRPVSCCLIRGSIDTRRRDPRRRRHDVSAGSRAAADDAPPRRLRRKAAPRGDGVSRRPARVPASARATSRSSACDRASGRRSGGSGVADDRARREHDARTRRAVDGTCASRSCCARGATRPEGIPRRGETTRNADRRVFGLSCRGETSGTWRAAADRRRSECAGRRGRPTETRPRGPVASR